MGFPVPVAASNPDHSWTGKTGGGESGIRRDGLRAAENQHGRGTVFSRHQEHPARRKEAASITPAVPQQPCQPDGPPSQHSCSLAERNFSPSGTGWGHSRGGHIYAVSGPMEPESPRLSHPHDHTLGPGPAISAQVSTHLELHNPGDRTGPGICLPRWGSHTRGKRPSTQVQVWPVVPGASCSRSTWTF